MPSKSIYLLAIYKELRKSSLNIEKLRLLSKNKGWNLSDRTLYRYMDELYQDFQFQGENIYINLLDKNKKEWKIEFDQIERANQNEDDIISYFLFKNYVPNSIRKNRDGFFDKLNEWAWKELSTSKTHHVINNNPDCFINTNFGETIYTENEKLLLKKLIEAIQIKVLVEICYQFDYTSLPNNQGNLIKVIPLKIVLHRGTLHICYSDTASKEVNLLALDQIISITFKENFLKKDISESTHLLEKLFGITNNIEDKTYSIELEISEMLGKFLIRREWHPSQKFKELQTGNYLMTMQCGINRELVGWVFSWMTNIKVLKPQKLRLIVAEKAEEIMTIYKKDFKISTNNSFKDV